MANKQDVLTVYFEREILDALVTAINKVDLMIHGSLVKVSYHEYAGTKYRKEDGYAIPVRLEFRKV